MTRVGRCGTRRNAEGLRSTNYERRVCRCVSLEGRERKPIPSDRTSVRWPRMTCTVDRKVTVIKTNRRWSAFPLETLHMFQHLVPTKRGNVPFSDNNQVDGIKTIRPDIVSLDAFSGDRSKWTGKDRRNYVFVRLGGQNPNEALAEFDQKLASIIDYGNVIEKRLWIKFKKTPEQEHFVVFAFIQLPCVLFFFHAIRRSVRCNRFVNDSVFS